MKALFGFVLLVVAGSAHAAQSLALTYATTQGDLTWQLRVAGTQVIAQDAAGLMRWSVSPSQGAARDCDGVTQLLLIVDDGNADGRIDTARGERARLSVSSSWRNREGWDSTLLMLDVSRPDTPNLLWRQDSGSLPSLARLVAEPAVATVRSFHTVDDKVLVIGAGLSTPATPTHTARSGAALLMLDAGDGHELWRAAASGTPTQKFPAMTAGMSGAVTVLDLNHDRLTERFYVGDAVATLWRFDLDVTATSPTSLMAGGPIARLASATNPTAQSIVAAPDVALFAPPGIAPWLNIAVGTSFAGAGTSPVPQGLFVLRDRHPFDALTQAQYDSLAVATPSNLQGGYAIDTGTDGIVGRALTAGGVLLYTQVQGDALAGICGAPATLLVKATAVTADAGDAALDSDGDGQPDRLPRVLRRRDGTTASPFDEPTALLDEIPATKQIRRRYWRREDAD